MALGQQMFTVKYKDVRGREHSSIADAEKANDSYAEDTKRLHEAGITGFDVIIVAVLCVLTLLLIVTFQFTMEPNHSSKYLFMHLALVCALWYGWYLLLKIPVNIRYFLYSVTFIVGICAGTYISNS